jgi:hypothetical protein
VLKDAEYAYMFSEGLAVFVTKERKYGFVDKTGKIVINAQFDEALPFYSGFAIVKRNDKYGFIDKGGTIAINPQFDHVLPFIKGKASFSNGKKWGFIDAKGGYVINPQFDYAASFSGGLAAVQQGSVSGYIDGDGKLVINPQFENASTFSNGLAAVRQGKTYGYIDKTGKYVINSQFENAISFCGKIAPVYSNNKWGFIDKKGKYVVNPQFDAVNPKMDGQLFYQVLANSYVKTDYYDASDFVKTFFAKDTGKDFDGITDTTTLMTLSEHPVYGAGLKDRHHREAIYNKSIRVTKDISISNVSFYFDEEMYDQVDRYTTDYYGNRYRSGTRKEYNYDAKPTSIRYTFDCSGDARDKYTAIASAIKTEIENRNNQKMEYEDISDDDDFGLFLYILSQDAGKRSFALIYNDYSIMFFVAFNKNSLTESIEMTLH